MKPLNRKISVLTLIDPRIDRYSCGKPGYVWYQSRFNDYPHPSYLVTFTEIDLRASYSALILPTIKADDPPCIENAR